MSEKLKPCPFCGSEAMPAEVEQIEHSGWVGRIECGTCDAVFSLQYSANSPGKAGNEVIATWNRRELESASQPGGGEADKRDAERWRMAVRYIGARYGETGEQRFWVSPILSCITVDLMKGSVAEHFTNAIDKQIAKFPDRAAPSAGNGGAEGV